MLPHELRLSSHILCLLILEASLAALLSLPKCKRERERDSGFLSLTSPIKPTIFKITLFVRQFQEPGTQTFDCEASNSCLFYFV